MQSHKISSSGNLNLWERPMFSCAEAYVGRPTAAMMIMMMTIASITQYYLTKMYN